MRRGKVSNVDHSAAERRLYDTVTHTDDEQEEEGKRVSGGVENSDNDEEGFGANIRGAVRVLEIYR